MGCASTKGSAGTATEIVEGSTTADAVEPAPLPVEQHCPSRTWTVRVEKKQDTIFGFKTEIHRAGLLIISIHRNGSLAKWNTENVEEAVRPGDMIIGLNGETDCRQIIKAMRSQILELEIQRTTMHRVKKTELHLVLASHLQANSNRIGNRVKQEIEGLSCVCAGRAKSTMCAICLDEYEDPLETVLELPCKHAFHQCCVLQWFEDGKLECPLCKQSLVSFAK